MRNTCARSIHIMDWDTKAYQVWQNQTGWTWYVLKKYQADDHKPYARWFCKVVTPFTGPAGDLGDVYAAEVMANATLMTDRTPAE